LEEAWVIAADPMPQRQTPWRPHASARTLVVSIVPGTEAVQLNGKWHRRDVYRPAILGGNVGYHHGGSTPQVKARAQRRLQQAADAMAQRLRSFALDDDVADPVALVAIRDALDRAGLGPR